jgi:hypothetical protein
MTYNTATLIEIIQRGSEIAGVLDLPAKHWPQPGQYLPCQPVTGGNDLLPTNLFRVLGHPGQLTLGSIPPAWQPGEELLCTAPQGHGFHIPASARRVGLIPYAVTPFRLLSLVESALSQRAMVAVFSDSMLSSEELFWMPSQVEVLHFDALVENPGWPDYLAIDLERSAIDQFRDQLPTQCLNCAGEVLVRTPMPCRGVGECGVCAVHTRRGWRFVCDHGPVFPMGEVLNVA